MKKNILLITIFIFLLNTPIITYAEPEISAKSAIVIECLTGKILYSKNQAEVLPMASTTKIMTALVAVEFGDLDREMTVSNKAAAVDGSQMGLLAEQKISFRDLLYMMLLKSANDAAEVIAENLCGSTEDFVELMNEKALELGCMDTHFANVHGLPHNDHYTTAENLAKIAAAAYENEVVREIVSTKTKKLEYFSLVLENSNKLLNSYPYTKGMKTGFTKAAGRCLVSAAEKDGITIIAVTLNAPDDWNDHEKMLDYGFSRVSLWEAVAAVTYSAEIPTLNGNSKAKLINTQPIYGLAIDGKAITGQLSENLPKLLFAPINAGKTCGSLQLTVNGKVFSSSPLAVAETVNEKYSELSFLERLLKFFREILFFSNL